MNKTANKVKQHVKNNGNDWIEKFARFGYMAKGAVYCLIGILAAAAAFGFASDSPDRQKAFDWVVSQPFGRIILGIAAIGFAGYSMWRFIQAIKDPGDAGNDAKGLARRAGYGGSGLIYLSIAFTAITQAFAGGSNGGGGSSNQNLVEKLLDQPFGPWLVGIVAAGFAGKAIWQFYRAFSGRYMKVVDDNDVGSKQKKVYKYAGFAGYTSRGVVIGIISYFFLRAALQSDPGEAEGTEGAFSFLRDSPQGVWLMAIVALGLFCYGIFMFVKSQHKEIELD